MSGKKPLARRLLGRIGRVIALALIITLAAALLPYARDWIGGLLPQGKYARVSTLLAHEMERAGDLVALRYRDTGLMEAGMDALAVGQVNSVKAPYAYEIGLGVHLAEVTLTPGEDGLTVAVPAAVMLYDSFEITDEPEISDFWRLLSQRDYQRMVDDQAAACRKAYVEDPAVLEGAWQAACEEMGKLFTQWAGEELPLTFARPGAEK